MEGPLDWLAAVAWGLPAFALCGTHFPTKRSPHSPRRSRCTAYSTRIALGAAPPSTSRLSSVVGGGLYDCRTAWISPSLPHSEDLVVRCSACWSVELGPPRGTTDMGRCADMNGNIFSIFRQLFLRSPRRSIEPYSYRPRVI